MARFSHPHSNSTFGWWVSLRPRVPFVDRERRLGERGVDGLVHPAMRSVNAATPAPLGTDTP